jgi:predicted AlkP superfamily pyrophosphatase or phosphodiesterase
MEYQHIILITILLLIFYLMTSNQCQNRYGNEYLLDANKIRADEAKKSKRKKDSTCAIM